jgi:hypothetical protein
LRTWVPIANEYEFVFVENSAFVLVKTDFAAGVAKLSC